MDIRSALRNILSAFFPRTLGRLKLKERFPQIIVAGILALGLLALIAQTLEETLIDQQPFSGTILYAMFHTTILFTQNFTATIASLGYTGIFALMLLESISLPIPSEIILPFAGYLVYTGQLNLLTTIAVSTTAAIAGCLIDFYIGMKGINLLTKQKTLQKLLNPQHMQTAQRWFDKYGAATVFFSRLAPGFRTLISFPAGAAKMPTRKFIAYSTAGCLLWDTILIYTGMIVGQNWQQVAGTSNYLIAATAAVTIAVIAIFAIKRKTKHHTNQTKTTPAKPTQNN